MIWLCFLPPETIVSIQFFSEKFKKQGVFTIKGIPLFRLSTDIPNKLTLKIRLSSLRTQTLFFFPIISLPTLKAVSTFRHSACCKCNLQRMAAGPRMAGLVLHPDYAWAVGCEGKPPDEWPWMVKKWNMSLYDSMSSKRYGDKQAPQNELIKSESYQYLSTK